MKSSLTILRGLLLLLFLLVLYVKVNALSISSNINSESTYFQYQKAIIAKQQGSDTNSVIKKNATPVIILLVVPYEGRIAQLSWTSSDYKVTGTYFIERLDPAGWVVLKQLPYDALRVYNDTISFPFCKASNISYRIRFISLTAPFDNTTSPDVAVNLYDQTPPADVQNLNVTIINSANGYKPRITWTQAKGDDIKKYVVLRYNGFNWPSPGAGGLVNIPPDSSGFTDPTISDVCAKSYRYVVSTIDRCDIPSSDILFEDMAVQTIKLEASQPEHCDKVAKLAWNSFVHMPDGLGGYTIYRSDAGNSSTKINLISPKDTVYYDNFNFVNGHTYTYTVKANSINGLYTSSSCPVDWLFIAALPPDVYITQASVENDSFVRVSYHLSPPGTVVKLILERSDNGTTNFQPIDSLVAALGSFVPEDLFIDDTTADVHRQSYYYRLVAYDECNKTNSTNTARSILLQGSTDQKTNILNWNSYETWTQGVERYTIYRILDSDPSTIEMLGTTDPTRVGFVDLLSGVDPTKAVCYWVVANEISTSAISKSNNFCIPKEPLLFMPNAFYPDGINYLLRPVPKPAFVDLQSFKMTVFSRWGQQLFETTDINTGWNGLINGQNAPAGLYTYILKYKSLEGKEYTKRGTASLIR